MSDFEKHFTRRTFRAELEAYKQAKACYQSIRKPNLERITFTGADSWVARAWHPIPNPLGGVNPGRMYEKVAMQERAWQLLLVLMLPITARLWVAFRSTFLT
jgi:hypothetical protein